MRQLVLLGLNRVDPMEPLLRRPKPLELPQQMEIEPQLSHDSTDIEPLYGNHDPKQRRRKAKWTLLQPPVQPPAQSNPPSNKLPECLKPLPPIKPPPPPQPRELQNRPNTKGRNTKKAIFKVSFVEPQKIQPVEQQPMEQQALENQEDQHQAADIKWNTVNKPTRKWVRKKGLSTASKPGEAVSNGVDSASILNSIDVKGMPPVDHNPLEPPKHQTSIQATAKKERRKQQQDVAAQLEREVAAQLEREAQLEDHVTRTFKDSESVEELVQGRNLRPRRAHGLENT